MQENNSDLKTLSGPTLLTTQLPKYLYSRRFVPNNGKERKNETD